MLKLFPKSPLFHLNLPRRSINIAGLAVIGVAVACLWNFSSYNREAKAGHSLSLAEQLLAEDTAESNNLSISKLEEALSIWATLGNRKQSAITLGKLGEALHKTGKSHTALGHYERALSLFRDLGDKHRTAEILNRISEAYLVVSDSKSAERSCTEALDISKEIGDRKNEAQSLNNIGEVYISRGKLLTSIDYYQRSLPIWTELDSSRGQAQTYMYFGYTYSDLGEPQKSLEYYNKAISIWRRINDRRGLGSALAAMGKLYSRLGDRQEAIKHFNQAMPLIKAAGDRIEEARALNGIGFVYETLGKPSKALEYYNQALTLYHSVSYRAGEATTFHEIGRAYLSIEARTSLNYFRCFLTLSQALNDRRRTAHALRGIGMVYDLDGDKLKALDYYNQALSLFQTGSDRRGEAFILNLIGRLHQSSGNRKEAATYYDQALTLNRKAEDRIRESLTLYNIADLELDEGNLSKSRMDIEQSIKTVESLRAEVGSMDLRASYLESVHQIYDLHLDILMQTHARSLSKKTEADAFLASERSRARSFLELLTESQANVLQWADPILIENSRKIQQQINLKAERKSRLLSSNASKGEIVAITKEADALIEEYHQAEAQIRLKIPRYAALTRPMPASVRDARRLLDNNTILLEYALGNKHSYLWVITSTGLKSYTLSGQDQIQNLARNVHNLISLQQLKPGQTKKLLEEECWREASKLSEVILGPIADQLGKKRLLIVPDGVLQYIPFQALPKPSTMKRRAGSPQERRPMMLDHEIVYLPSASTLVVLRQELSKRAAAPKSIAVVADPVFESDDMRFIQPKDKPAGQVATNRSASGARADEQTRDGSGLARLHSTIEEFNAIKAVTDPRDRLELTGFAATRSAALDGALSQYRIIHFATHGDLDSQQPELSSIVLSLYDKNGQRQEGHLRLHDIYNMNLPADLIVLSACETALGKEIKGEGLIGLTRGFMYAGAARVMASLWKVNDRSTAELMTHFYRFHLKDGMSPAAALRRAQIEMWKQDEWRAPYHWAGFVLQGEYK